MAIVLKESNVEQVKENFEQIAANQVEIDALKNGDNDGYTKAEIDAQQLSQDTKITGNESQISLEHNRITENTREIEANTSAIQNIEESLTIEPVDIDKPFVQTDNDWNGDPIRAGAWVDLGDVIQQPVGTEVVIRLNDGNNVLTYINGRVGFSVDVAFFSQQNAQLRVENMSEEIDNGDGTTTTRHFIGVYIWENSTENSIVLETIAKSGINQADPNKLNRNFSNVLVDENTPSSVAITVDKVANRNNPAEGTSAWVGTQAEYDALATAGQIDPFIMYSIIEVTTAVVKEEESEEDAD